MLEFLFDCLACPQGIDTAYTGAVRFPNLFIPRSHTVKDSNPRVCRKAKFIQPVLQLQRRHNPLVLSIPELGLGDRIKRGETYCHNHPPCLDSALACGGFKDCLIVPERSPKRGHSCRGEYFHILPIPKRLYHFVNKFRPILSRRPHVPKLPHVPPELRLFLHEIDMHPLVGKEQGRAQTRDTAPYDHCRLSHVDLFFFQRNVVGRTIDPGLYQSDRLVRILPDVVAHPRTMLPHAHPPQQKGVQAPFLDQVLEHILVQRGSTGSYNHPVEALGLRAAPDQFLAWLRAQERIIFCDCYVEKLLKVLLHTSHVYGVFNVVTAVTEKDSNFHVKSLSG
ncbi:MAG: hypothetical protein A4E62_00888 [Syntrophorhabdus sp. PtaU1.Bin002]|nr:MAG: hypothetical protein A4E62_00888 [Syntrophorhabdus sp. PtaU1.Bin002]